MPPDNSRRSSSSLGRSYARPTGSAAPRRAPQQASQAAASGIVRDQIDNIYQEDAKTHAQAEAQAAFTETSHDSPDSPYDRTHEPGRTKLQENQWKRYHSAWQDYYRQYYERYYLGEVYRLHQSMHTQPQPTTSIEQPANTNTPLQENEVPDSGDAFHGLRGDLLRTVHD